MILIKLLAEYCQLQRAALYPVLDGKVNDQAAALLGRTSLWISTMPCSTTPGHRHAHLFSQNKSSG
ncbi:hypothetical protein [Alcanivorax sp.]|uniref:hypothetical protein n=1 Tax=Alcanivorax sp. TaxID=1872427 RepID=UPI0025C0B0C8|nr:hypothetical protein [Alcanivorax sp.]